MSIRELQITPEQARILNDLNGAVAGAQQRLNIALSAIAAGHGVVDAEVLDMDRERNVLRVNVKEEAEDG